MTSVTSMSSRGQVVIPQEIRERLGLKEGEKFAVMAKENTIMLEKIRPSFEGFDEFLKETRAWAKKKGITQNDVDDTIRRVREARRLSEK